MLACSHACAAPPRSTRAAASWSRSAAEIVHQTARVSRWRGGRSSGSSPRDAPVLGAALGVADHLPGDLDVAEPDLGLAPGHAAQLVPDLDLGHVPGGGGVPGIARLDQRHPVGQVEPADQVAVALVQVDRAVVDHDLGRRLVDGADQPPGGLLHDQDRGIAGPAQPARRGHPPAHAVPARRAPAQPAGGGQVVDHLARPAARRFPGPRRSGPARPRPRTGAAPARTGCRDPARWPPPGAGARSPGAAPGRCRAGRPGR